MSIKDLIKSRVHDPTVQSYSADIVTFANAPWGLGLNLHPAQQAVVKLFYGIPLDKRKKNVEVTKAFSLDPLHVFTEFDFVKYLIDSGKCNLLTPDEFLDTYELLLVTGRRGGKTTVAAMIVVYEVLKVLQHKCPQMYYQMATPYEDIDVINVATSEKQAGVLFGREMAFAQRCNFFRPYRMKPNKKELRFRTQYELDTKGKDSQGSVILSAKPCSARSIRGYNSICVLIDEQAHFMDVAGSDKSDYAVYDALTPSIGGFCGPTGDVEGRVVSLTSPLGKSGLTFDAFEQGFKADTRTDRLVFQIPTWMFNPRVDRKFLKSEFNKKGKVVFDMEYGGEFGDASYPWMVREMLEEVCVRNLEQVRKHRSLLYHVGIDLGTINDGCAVSITYPDIENNTVEHVFSEVRYAGQPPYENQTELDFEELALWIKEIRTLYPFVDGMLDQFSGVFFNQMLCKNGVDMIQLVNMTRSLNSQMYKTFESLIRDKRVFLLYDEELINELCSLECTHFSKYEYKVEAPQRVGFHDDLSDSLVRSVYLSTQKLASPDSRPKRILNSAGNSVSAKTAYMQYRQRNKRLAGRGVFTGRGSRR